MRGSIVFGIEYAEEGVEACDVGLFRASVDVAAVVIAVVGLSVE